MQSAVLNSPPQLSAKREPGRAKPQERGQPRPRSASPIERSLNRSRGWGGVGQKIDGWLEAPILLQQRSARQRLPKSFSNPTQAGIGTPRPMFPARRLAYSPNTVVPTAGQVLQNCVSNHESGSAACHPLETSVAG